MPTDPEHAAPLSAEEPSEEALAAYLQFCAEWGGFDSADDAKAWAQRSIAFQEQVEAHARLLDSFALATLRAKDAEILMLRETLRRIPSITCPCCGCEGAWPTLFEDGGPTDCGCGGHVSVDIEDREGPVTINVPECVNSECQALGEAD